MEVNNLEQYFNMLDNLLEDHLEEISGTRICSLFHINPIQSRSLLENYIKSSRRKVNVKLLVGGTLLDSTKAFILTPSYSLKEIQEKFQYISSIEIYSLSQQPYNNQCISNWQKEIKEVSNLLSRNPHEEFVWTPEFSNFEPLKLPTRKFNNNINTSATTTDKINFEKEILSCNNEPFVKKISNPENNIPISNTIEKNFMRQLKHNPSTEKVLDQNPKSYHESEVDVKLPKKQTKRSKVKNPNITSFKKIKMSSLKTDNNEPHGNPTVETARCNLFESGDEYDEKLIKSKFIENSEDNHLDIPINITESIPKINCQEPQIIMVQRKVEKEVAFEKDGYLIIEKAPSFETQQIEKPYLGTVTTAKHHPSGEKPKSQSGILAYFKKKQK